MSLPLPPDPPSAPAGLACALCWHPGDVIDPGSGAVLCAECYYAAVPPALAGTR
jgi:hypothetical protein